MKVKIFLLGSFLTLATLMSAQEDNLDLGGEGSRIRAMRVTYLTERMQLTTEQADKFWALESKFEAEKKVINRKYNQPIDRNTSNDQARQIILDRLQGEEEKQALKRKFIMEAMNIVSPRQVLMYHKASREFKQDLLRNLQRRRAGRNND